MMDDRSIFLGALERRDPAERKEFLDEACRDDNELRRRVDRLLAAHADAGSFLEQPPEGIHATVGLDSGHPAGSADDWHALLEPSETPGCLGVIGPYEIVELIGRGGMGIVLRGHDPRLKRTVAIKLLSPELSANTMSVRRFLREAQAAAAVSHDHVVTIYAIDEHSRPPLLVMEYVHGKSLQQKIDAEGALNVTSILRIGMQTAAGLAAAHRQGLVHRDVKPSNILLENSIERVKLSDFGLARAVDEVGVTRTGQITGTPQYMSPEQAQGLRVDHRTDLFSLGGVLYAMCTGQAAFRADSAIAVMHRVVHDTPRPIAELNHEIPDWLCEIVDKLLEKSPDDRFESAEAVAELLSQHLAHQQQPRSVPRPKSIGRTRTTSPKDSASAAARSVRSPASLHRRAARLLTAIGTLDIVMCLALFFGIAPGLGRATIPPWLAFSSIASGLCGVALLVATLRGRRTSEEGVLNRSTGRGAALLAILPIGLVHILALPVSIWILRAFRQSPADSPNPAVPFPGKVSASWPPVYIGAIAIALFVLALERDHGFLLRSWLQFTGQGRLTLNLPNSSVHVELNNVPQSVTSDHRSVATLAPGRYLIRSRQAGTVLDMMYHDLRAGLSITQQINSRATDVAVLGPLTGDDQPRDAQSAPQATLIAAELQRMQGVWKPIEAESYAESFLREELLEFDLRISGAEVFWESLTDNDRARLTLDPARSPKQIDLVLFDDSAWLLGIYKLADDELSIAFILHGEGERPRDFVADKVTRVVRYRREGTTDRDGDQRVR